LSIVQIVRSTHEFQPAMGFSLPTGVIGRGLEVEEDSIGCGVSIHGDGKARPREHGAMPEEGG